MKPEHVSALESVRRNIKNAEDSLTIRFGGEMPSDPGAAVQDTLYAIGSLTDLVEELLEELASKKES